MGKFEVSNIVDLKDIKLADPIIESDYAFVTSDNKFVQFRYKQDEIKREPYKVKPGIWAIEKMMGQMHLVETSFNHDSILKDLIKTKDVVDKVDCFFANLDVYYENGIEVPVRNILLFGPAGCHAKGTKILMYDGSTKNVEDIIVGEQLMGPDSKPREVLKLARGQEKMLKVKPVKGEEFIVNYNHKFHLTPSYKNETIKCPIDITGKDILENTAKPVKDRYKLTRTGVNFSKKDLKIDPYILGNWLGDGHSDGSIITSMDSEILQSWINYSKELNMNHLIRKLPNNKAVTLSLSSKEKTKGKNVFINKLRKYNLLFNKHIPFDYLTSTRKDRLLLLAGLIDTDGTTSLGMNYCTKSDKLANDVVYLCRSLGLAAYKSSRVKAPYINGVKGKEGTYFYISISGNLEEIPVKLERKKAKTRKQIKDVLRTGFSLEVLPEDNYYGFTLDKDHLYLTSDFIIHHNSGKTTGIIESIDKYTKDNETAVVVWHTDKWEPFEIKDFVKSFEYVGVKKLIVLMEDLGGIELDKTRIRSDSSLLSLLDNKEKTFSIPTMVIATTNHIEVFMGNLVNRPGRFDDKIKVGFPSSEERVKLLEFFSKGQATKADITEFEQSIYNEFSPAHVREAILRSKLHKKTLIQVMREVQEEIELYKKDFEERIGKMGFN